MGLGRAMLEWAEAATRAKGRPFVRLDTAFGNPRIRAYYEELGFEYRGEKTLTWEKGSYHYALYEKRIA